VKAVRRQYLVASFSVERVVSQKLIVESKTPTMPVCLSTELNLKEDDHCLPV